MSTDIPHTALQLLSLVKRAASSRSRSPTSRSPAPGADEVLVRVEAAPINPSDLGLLFGPADMGTATASGRAGAPAAHRAHSRRRDERRWPAGSTSRCRSATRAPGVVVAAGSSPAAQALLGKTVAVLGGAMYSQYRCVDGRAVPGAARRARRRPKAPRPSSIR